MDAERETWGVFVQLNDMFKATGLVDRFRFWFQMKHSSICIDSRFERLTVPPYMIVL